MTIRISLFHFFSFSSFSFFHYLLPMTLNFILLQPLHSFIHGKHEIYLGIKAIPPSIHNFSTALFIFFIICFPFFFLSRSQENQNTNLLVILFFVGFQFLFPISNSWLFIASSFLVFLVRFALEKEYVFLGLLS